MEYEFWLDPAIVRLLLSIDSWVWVMVLINTCTEAMGRASNSKSLYYIVIQGPRLAFLMVALAIRFFAHHYPDTYYPYRRMCMLGNRLARILVLGILAIAWRRKPTVMVGYVTGQVASGRNPVALVIYLLLRVSGSSYPAGLMFPLPFRLAIWIECVQQVCFATLFFYPGMLALGCPSVKGITTKICKLSNMVVVRSTTLICGLPWLESSLRHMDNVCERDGPLLLVLFVWWVGGCLFPVGTAWLLERHHKYTFLERRGRLPEAQEPPMSVKMGICTWLVVASISWMGLHSVLTSSVCERLYSFLSYWYK